MMAVNLSQLVALIFSSGLMVALVRLLSHWLDTRVAMRRVTGDQAEKLITQQNDIIERQDRRIHAVELAAEQERRMCDAHLRVLRHRVNNLDSNFDGLVLMYEVAPERAVEFVARFRAMRAEQRETEAMEKAALLAARNSTRDPDTRMDEAA